MSRPADYLPGTGTENPLATRIAGQLAAPLLVLRTRTLVRDICQVFGCSEHTAMVAVGIARKRPK